jgi:hypothetical protein
LRSTAPAHEEHARAFFGKHLRLQRFDASNAALIEGESALRHIVWCSQSDEDGANMIFVDEHSAHSGKMAGQARIAFIRSDGVGIRYAE